MADLYIARLITKADLTFDQAGLFTASLDDATLSSSYRRENGVWHFLWTLPGTLSLPEIKARLALGLSLHDLPAIDLGALVHEPLPDTDWLAASYQGFQPFALGPFFIYGAHHRDSIRVPAGALPLEIDAATAFGSGEHGTTAGCLLALAALKDQGFAPQTCLDMGTGSGILAIGAARLWPTLAIAAVDNDPECIRVTQRHQAANAITKKQMRSFVSEGFSDPRVHGDGPYDLVIANILAGPLITMAAELARATAPGGYLILSGLLDTQKDDILAAYIPQGMAMMMADSREGWSILTLAPQA